MQGKQAWIGLCGHSARSCFNIKAGGTYIYHCNLKDLKLQPPGCNADGQIGLLRTCCVRSICAASFAERGIWCESALLLPY